MSKLGPISHFLYPVSCDSLVLQGLRCEWGAGVLNLVLSLSLSYTGHWKFNMAPHGKELSEDLKKRMVALHKDGVGYKKIAKTLKLSCSTVAKTIQRFNRTGSTQNRPRHLVQMVSSVCGGNQVRSTKTSVSCLQSSMVVSVSWSGAAWVLPALGSYSLLREPWMPTCTVTYWSRDWAAGQYSNMITTPNTPPRRPLPC